MHEPMSLGALSSDPLCSVIVANFNYAAFVRQSIKSVFAQTYANWEILICDDGSVDESVALIQSLGDCEGRLHLITKTNGGMASAWNRCMEVAKGEIICVLDADDTFEPGKLRAVVDAFADNPNAGLCIHKLTPIDAEGEMIGPPLPRVIGDGWLGPQMLRTGGRGPLPPASGLAMRRQVAAKVFPCPLALRRCADGYVGNASALVTTVCKVDTPQARYRVHGNNLTGLHGGSQSAVATTVRDYELVDRTLNAFIRCEIGDQVANEVKLSDYRPYVEATLAARLFAKTLSVRGVLLMLKRFRNPQRDAIWITLAVIPTSLAQLLLRLWWGPSAVKRIVHRLAIQR